MNTRKDTTPIKYPRLRDHNLDRRFKLTEKQIAKIRKLRLTGDYSISRLAKQFNVSRSTISYYVYPKVMATMKKKNAKRKCPNRYECTKRARKLLYQAHRKYLTYIRWKNYQTV